LLAPGSDAARQRERQSDAGTSVGALRDMGMGKLLVGVLRSDVVAGVAAVVGYTAVFLVSGVVLSWLVYRQRYGLDFIAFLQVSFGPFP